MSFFKSIFHNKKKNGNEKVLVAGYPRSGNSWFNYMLANMLAAKWIDIHKPDVGHNDPEVRRRTGWAKEGLDHSSQYSLVVKSHHKSNNVKDLESYSKTILLVRDPRDVVVSYFFFKFSHVAKLKNYESINLENSDEVTERLSEFLVEIANEWKTHYNSWQPYDKYTLKYEDLLHDTEGVLKSVCEYLNYTPEQKTLTDVLEFFKFEKMSGGRSPGNEQHDKFIRKGITGDYKNYMTNEQIKEMHSICGNEMNQLGYNI